MTDRPGADAAEPIRTYSADDFKTPSKDCDLVMKGGVTSGVVYPYAILELAKVYRFRSIGGTSAGAIAATFAAAAEYSRSIRGDPSGFLRLQARCDALPARLASLFQPSPGYATLMRYLLKAQTAGGAAWVWALPVTFWGTTSAGLFVGAASLWVLGGGYAGAGLGAITGVLAALTIRLVGRIAALPENGFGLCPGLTQPGAGRDGLTDWLHASLQHIAFGDEPHEDPLTFGDLGEGADPPIEGVDLRMITTNMTQHRPHSLPTLGMVAGFKSEEWRKLFPADVLAFMEKRSFRKDTNFVPFPQPDKLPVVVAVRMSLSFPFLFSAIPLVAFDRDTRALLARLKPHPAPPKPRSWRRLWFTDGGLSSNFPIHMFDAVLPARPTFALSLESLPDGVAATERVLLAQTAGDGVGLPAYEIDTVVDFAGGILGSAKDWQDQMLARMPGQRERIAQVYLSKAEGGLNLTMPHERSRALMGYGLKVGEQFAAGAFDFDEHRWRRTLVAYEQIEKSLEALDRVWSGADFAAVLQDHRPASYKHLAPVKGRMHERLATLAGVWAQFQPPLAKTRKFPRPTGRLRIGPEI